MNRGIVLLLAAAVLCVALVTGFWGAVLIALVLSVAAGLFHLAREEQQQGKASGQPAGKHRRGGWL